VENGSAPMNHIERLPKGIVVGAKVVDAPDQANGFFHPIHFSGQMPGPSHEESQPGAEGRNQPLNEGRVEHAAILSGAQQMGNDGGASLYNPTLHTHYPPPGISLDDLSQMDIRPRHQAGAAGLAGMHWDAKGLHVRQMNRFSLRLWMRILPEPTFP